MSLKRLYIKTTGSFGAKFVFRNPWGRPEVMVLESGADEPEATGIVRRHSQPHETPQYQSTWGDWWASILI